MADRLTSPKRSVSRQSSRRNSLDQSRGAFNYSVTSAASSNPFDDRNATNSPPAIRPMPSATSLNTFAASGSSARPSFTASRGARESEEDSLMPLRARPYHYNSSRQSSAPVTAKSSQLHLPLLSVPPSSKALADMLDRCPSQADLRYGAGLGGGSRRTSRNPSRRSSFSSDKYDDEEARMLGAFNISSSDFAHQIDEKEDDDYLHDPRAADPRYDGKWYRNKRGLLNAGSLILLLVSIVVLFILLPALTYSGRLQTGPPDPDYLNSDAALLKHTRTSMIDPDTPTSAYTKQSVHGKQYKLVFSDEFNQDGRTFYNGDDQFWEAVDIWYGATQDLEWYDPDAITTKNGSLVISFEQFKSHNLSYRSGMLQSWNKLCFKGGMIEVTASLPGSGDVPGLWPGIWTLGNLGRPGYLATTDGTWPYSYSSCDAGITANQSQSDGLSYLPGQRLSSCTCTGADHPTPGTGRGAPEIDVVEATVGAFRPDQNTGVVSQSLQTAPFDLFWTSNADYLAVNNYSVTNMNSWTGGPYQQALSGVTTLNRAWYEGRQFQSYAFDYVPGGASGRVAWHVGSDWTWQMLGAAVGPNGNVGQRLVPVEPMSIVLNLGMSPSWVYIDFENLQFPATMHIDSVRIYQDPKDASMSLTCDPPGYETTGYIKDHPIAYANPNLTHWSQTGYSWPKNKLTGC